VLDESNAKAAEINRRAYEVSQESEALHARVQQYVEQQRRDALEQARNLIEAARLQAEAVTRESEEFSERLFGRALTRLEQMRGEMDYVQEFVNRRKAARTTDAVIAELEQQLSEA
jgi:selenocysteine-specific translation elongation factor